MSKSATPLTDALDKLMPPSQWAATNAMRKHARRMEQDRAALIEGLNDINQHANHARKHGVAELAFESIRDKARTLRARMKDGT